MSRRKIGEIFAQAWLKLGMSELRNAVGFEQSNIQGDIRQHYYDARQDVNDQHSPQQDQGPAQQQNLELEQGL